MRASWFGWVQCPPILGDGPETPGEPGLSWWEGQDVGLGDLWGWGGDLEGHTQGESSLAGKILGTRPFALSHSFIQTPFKKHPVCAGSGLGAVIQLIYLSFSWGDSVPGRRDRPRQLWSMAGIGGGWGSGNMCRARWGRSVTVTAVNSKL